ncbi:hypothetical protein Leryth_017577 [Lithospermum erythrorhizon]|nr:hypothetical protein Leryth_017577 [Lithospermum erythrorhizon]
MTPHLKVSKREDGRDDNCFIAGEDSNAKHAETSHDRPVFPDSGISLLHSRNDGFEVEHLEDDNGNYRTSKYVDNFKHLSAVNGSHVSHGSRRSIGHLSAKVNDIKIQTAPANYARSNLPMLENDYSINSVDDTPHTNSRIRPSSDDKYKDCAPSTLSCMGVGLSVKSSSCEPSISTSDFWDGKLVQGRRKTDSPDGSAHCFLNEVDEHDVTGSQVSPHDIAKISLHTRSQQTVTETKKPSNSYTHIYEETEGYVPRESLKSSEYGLGHVKPNDPNLKPLPMPTKHAPATLSGKIESGISCLNKLESRKPNSVTSKRATDPLPSSLQRPLKQHARDSGTEMLTKYKGLFPYDLFLKLYNWKEVQFRPCGFVNCGNSCYANAVLQCLASTPPLTSYFLQGLHSKSCGKRDWCFACEFESLMLRAKAGASHLSPIRIISHLQNIGSHLKNGREEDAHEFLRYAIDAMQSTSLIEAGLKESSFLEEGTTLLGLTFGGTVHSKIECMRCGSKFARHEKMMDLTVEINGDIGTLEEALKQYTSVETLDDDNKYRCGCCNSYVKAKKKLKVMEAPNVLTIALKRYQLGEFGKLNKRVHFSEILNLAPYICGTSDKSPIYGLYGVIVHLDTKNAAFSGHYVCYVKNSQNQWFMVDDGVVKGVDIGMVLTRDAYMLFYARYSPRAPRLIRSSVIPRDPKNSQYDMCKSRSLCRDSWGVSTSEAPLNGEACLESTNLVRTSLRPRMVNPDYGSSDNSTFFSESLSCGTDSSNRDSAINDEHLDLVAMSAFWNNRGRHSPDSDTSSSSSFLSPLCL